MPNLGWPSICGKEKRNVLIFNRVSFLPSLSRFCCVFHCNASRLSEANSFVGDRRIIVVAGIAKRFSGSLSREIYYYEAERGRRLSHCTHADNNRFARNIRIDLDVDLPDNNGRNVRHRRHGSLAFLFARGSKPCTHTHTHTHTEPFRIVADLV